MVKSVFNQPTPEQLDAFVAGDPIAIDEVVSLLLPQLYRWATNQYRNLPADEVQSTVNLVFTEVCRNHARYAPDKSRLTTYVIRLLKLRLADIHQKMTKSNENEVEDSLDMYEKLFDAPYNDISTIDGDTRLTRNFFFQEASLSLDTHEQDFLELMLKGEKSQQIFVSILAKHGLPISDPDHAVKNVKERLIRKLKTIADDAGYSLQDLSG